MLQASLRHHIGPWALGRIPTSLPATAAWDGHFKGILSTGWTVLPTAPEGWRCHRTAHQDLGKNHWDIRETQELMVGDSQKRTSPFSTTVSAQTLLLPSSQPTSWPPARGSCRDITPWPSTSSTPGDAGCEERSVTGPSTASLPSSTSLSPAGTGTLPALPENMSQKASRFTRAPREGKHPPSPSTFLPVLHQSPGPKEPPELCPSHHLPGRQGGGTTLSRAIKHRWYFPCSIKTKKSRAEPQAKSCRWCGRSEERRGARHRALQCPIHAIPVSTSAQRV